METHFLSPILLNFSNHPLSTWPEEQIKSAQTYGEVIDLPFPSIPPSATEKEVSRMAAEYVDMIIGYQKEHKVTVHIMGEMTFTFAMVTALKAVGINCVASCTERIVKERAGTKISEFHFKQFRNY